MTKHRRLQDAYQFPGFRPKAAIKGIFADPKSVVIELVRLQKSRAYGYRDEGYLRLKILTCMLEAI